MKDKHLHIISFTVPYPPNYGGVIDVFYKLKALHEQGLKIHLHCFAYDRKPAPELEEFCVSVKYYERKTGILSALSTHPYIVKSRTSEELIQNLLEDEYPILFEGLHTCGCLDDIRLNGRVKIYRESNIEHEYYAGLAKGEKAVLKKVYFKIASVKLEHFEKILKHTNLMLAVSETDAEYLRNKFPEVYVKYLPSFHPYDNVESRTGKGEYALYHGNLGISENEIAAEYLIKNIFKNNKIPLVIAGLNPSKSLQQLCSDNKIELIGNPPEKQMGLLIENAHVNVLVTFQATGLKLKLLSVLYKGRFSIVNNAMLSGTGLDECCIIANTPGEIKEQLNKLFTKEFEQKEIEKRKLILEKNYSNEAKAKRLIDLIF